MVGNKNPLPTLQLDRKFVGSGFWRQKQGNGGQQKPITGPLQYSLMPAFQIQSNHAHNN